ncbi:MAG: NERD domain-containing protein [Christensenellaceae bacterium]|nr:NERD domain-containing protein [Christensenellaceae bacterium]
MAKGLIDIILDRIFDANWVGRRGEKLTERELNFVRLFGRKGKILRNIYVPKDNGETSEIDVVFITQKGIFVIESKNYSGWIFGNEKSSYWTAMLPNKEKNQFYNPIKQNRTHMKWLGLYLQDEIPLFSLIVFSERCELKKISLDSADARVIKRDGLYATVCSIWENAEDVLSNERVDEIYNRLKILTNVDAATREAHIANINIKYKKTIPAPSITDESKPETNKSQDIVLCPKCGGQLILKTAKRGANAGNQFYGCSNFPKCKYVQKFDNQ